MPGAEFGRAQQAPEDGDGGIEPERLEEDAAEARPPVEIAQRFHFGRRKAVDLLAHPRLLVTVAAQEVDRPEQGPGRGVEAGGKHRGNLDAYLGVGEGGAAFRVARRQEQAEHVRFTGLPRSAALVDDGVHLRCPLPAEGAAGAAELP